MGEPLILRIPFILIHQLSNDVRYRRFEVFIAVKTESYIISVMKRCIMPQSYQYFWGTSCLHFQIYTMKWSQYIPAKHAIILYNINLKDHNMDTAEMFLRDLCRSFTVTSLTAICPTLKNFNKFPLLQWLMMIVNHLSMNPVNTDIFDNYSSLLSYPFFLAFNSPVSKSLI